MDRTRVVSVSVELEQNQMKSESKATENLNFMRALLKYLLEGRGMVRVTIELLLLYEDVTKEGSRLPIELVQRILQHEISRYDRVYFVIDGFHLLQKESRDDLVKHCQAMFGRTGGKLSVLLFMRDDEESQSLCTFCDVCGDFCDVYLTCPVCLKAKPRAVFDICIPCSDQGKNEHDQSHELRPRVEVTMPLLIGLGEIGELIRSDLQLSDSGHGFARRGEDEALESIDASSTGSDSESAASQYVQLNLMRSKHLTGDSFGMYDDKERQQPRYRSWLAAELQKNETLLDNLAIDLAVNVMGNIRLLFEWLRRLKSCLHQADLDKVTDEFKNNAESPYFKEMTSLRRNGERGKSALAIFALVLVSKRPLHIDELRTAGAALSMRSPGGTKKIEDAKIARADVTGLTHGFLQVSKDKEAEVRYSIAAAGQSWTRLLGAPHTQMAEACLSFLGQERFRKPQPNPSAFWTEYGDFSAYATCYWAYHIQESILENREKSEILEKEACELLKDPVWLRNYCQAWWHSSFKETEFVIDVPSGLHPLHVCAVLGFQNLIDELWDGKDVDVMEQRNGQTPLMYACRHGNSETAGRLLDLDANASLMSKLGRTALVESICQQRVRPDEALTELLLARGVEIGSEIQNEQNRKRTALMHAARQGLARTVQLLLEAGADATLCDSRGQTALMLAAQQSNPDSESYSQTVQLLLEHDQGRTVDLFGDEWCYKTTALHMSVEGRNAKIVDLLLHNGADRLHTDVWGYSAVQKTQVRLCMHRVRAVVERYVQSDDETSRPMQSCYPPELAAQYPLHSAIEKARSWYQSVEEVLDVVGELDLEARDCFGLTAMDVAMYHFSSFGEVYCFPAIVFLLEHEAEIQFGRVENLELLLVEAIKGRYDRAVERLLDAGADVLRLTRNQSHVRFEKLPIDELAKKTKHGDRLMRMVREAAAGTSSP